MSSSNSNAKHVNAPPYHGGYPANPAGGGGQFGSQSNQGNLRTGTISGSITVPTYGTLASPIGSIDKLTGVNLAQPPKFPLMHWGSMDMGAVDIIFYEEENGHWVKAALAPAFDLTAGESLNIQLLIVKATANVHYSSVKPLTFIRAKNLERHFNISLA